MKKPNLPNLDKDNIASILEAIKGLENAVLAEKVNIKTIRVEYQKAMDSIERFVKAIEIENKAIMDSSDTRCADLLFTILGGYKDYYKV